VKVKKKMKAIIYSKPNCSFCVKAKEFMAGADIEYSEYTVGKDILWETVRTRAKTDVTTVPQIWIDGQYVGGYTDLVKWYSENL
jgi:glutaredoxin